VDVVAFDPAAQPQLPVSPGTALVDVPQQDSFAAGSQHDACTDGAQQEEGSDMGTGSLEDREISMCEQP
jgi:hypothetical protein